MGVPFLVLLSQVVCHFKSTRAHFRPVISTARQPVAREKSAENGALNKEAPVNQPHAKLIATYRRAEAEAAHKFGLVKTVAAKGPKAIQAAVEIAAKAAKRRDSYAEKLAELGVDLKD